MDRLCDEIVQLIFYELTDPSPLTQVSRRFHRFSQDPYVRAHYFLAHYGPLEAIYHALGRGRVMTERVFDILLTSGAKLSRYLIQIAIHHYFHTQSHFIKSPWVRTVPLRVFTYFLQKAEEIYGEIPHGKGEDDGSVFSLFLKESRFPPQMKSVSWETIREILEIFNFIPFSNKDPIMTQFPLALAIEPRLLPFAVANGFQMDSKYRDFVFRKMFERPAASTESRADDIAHNVRELCRLDPMMFVTRTVAAEVCMEAKTNEAGYNALKLLDKSGHLRFELSSMIESLLKTFLTTRSICNTLTGDCLRFLYADFPSSDPTVRLVILVIIFIAAENLHMNPATIQGKLDALSLTPITRKDAYNVLVNPFVERYNALVEYAQQEIGENEAGTKGLGDIQIKSLVEEVAAKCLEVACKGKLLKKLYEGFPFLHTMVMRPVVEKYQLQLEDLPSWEEDEVACQRYEAKLSRDFMRFGIGEVHSVESLVPDESDDDVKSERDDDDIDHDIGHSEDRFELRGAQSALDIVVEAQEDEDVTSSLGIITQESLSTMIRHDEVTPVRSRRRMYYPLGVFGDSAGKLHYPHDPLHVGRWVKSQFGAKSSITAIFMTHAVINDNCTILHCYLSADANQTNLTSSHVPVTFKHFKMLARLGRAPHYYVYHDIETGAEFYMDENDYASKTDAARCLLDSEVKTESLQGSVPPFSSIRGKKRPRRSTAVAIRSYAVPDSDDDAIVDDGGFLGQGGGDKKKKMKDSSLQMWVKHLAELLKEEQRKYKEKKKRLERATEPGVKLRVNKTEFLKSLGSNLRNLRKIEQEKRLKYFGLEEIVDDYSDDDEEYTARRPKKRRGVNV